MDNHTVLEVDSLELKLTQADRDCTLFRKLNAYLQEELSSLRVKNDQPLDALSTAFLRGRLKEVSILQARLNAPVELEIVD